jgi:hypothetical protein
MTPYCPQARLDSGPYEVNFLSIRYAQIPPQAQWNQLVGQGRQFRFNGLYPETETPPPVSGERRA